MSIDTTHFKLASRRHGWNWSQNASDRKGLLSFGCSLEQLELLGMLESHIERLERLEKAARDLAALSKDRFIERSVYVTPRGPRVPNWAYNATHGDFRSRPTRLAWRANYSARVLAYAHDYPISPRPSLGIPGTPASCWGRRESHFGTMLVCAPLSKQL